VLQLCAPQHIEDCRPGEVMSDHPVAAASADAPADVMALAALEVPAGQADGAARVDVLAANTHGAPNVGSFTVVKAEEQGVKEFDDVYLALHLPRAQRLVYGGDEPRVTAVEVQLRHTNQLPAARQRIEQILATHFADHSLAVLDFAALNPFYGQTNSMFSVIFGFMLGNAATEDVSRVAQSRILSTGRVSVICRSNRFGSMRQRAFSSRIHIANRNRKSVMVISNMRFISGRITEQK
jgi:putative ABC transport system permease protein